MWINSRSATIGPHEAQVKSKLQGENEDHHERISIFRHIKVASQDIKLKLGCKNVFQIDGNPKHTNELATKVQSQCFGEVITKP